jgi:hypothetical protein
MEKYGYANPLQETEEKRTYEIWGSAQCQCCRFEFNFEVACVASLCDFVSPILWDSTVVFEPNQTFAHASMVHPNKVLHLSTG